MTTPAVYRPPADPSVQLTTLYVDGMPLDDLQALYDYNTKILGGSKWNGPNQFWATPARGQYSSLREILDVSIGSTKLVNRISFQISKFPCRAWLEYRDADGNWKPLRNARTRKPVIINLTESVPRRIHPDVFDSAHRHPHHRAAGHWHDVELKVRPVRTSRLRVVLGRLPSKHAPVAIGTGKPTGYSLAVKDFQFGYEVTSPADVPQTSSTTQVVTDSEAFATSTDLLGSAVQFAYTAYDANDLLWPSLAVQAGVQADQADGIDEIWKCEPQPYPYCVVNLYVDARDAQGDGQPVDRFYLNPATTGVGVNLYYSNDDMDLSAGFEASDDAIRYPGLQAHGGVTADANGVMFPGTTFGYLDLDRRFIRPSNTLPWWMGAKFQPQFDTTDTTEHIILATPQVEIAWRDQQWQVNVNGTSMQRGDLAFGPNDGIGITVASDGATFTTTFHDGWSAVATLPSTVRTRLDDATLAASPTLANIWRFGAPLIDLTSVEGDPGMANYRLNAFVLKQEQATDEAVADWFDLDADTYLLPADIDSEDEYDYTTNALLRVLPFFQTSGASSRNPYGFVGGPADPYDTLVWTPINREYTLQKGYLKFDPVKAKFFKFEFSNLSPQPYQTYTPVQRKVRLFTSQTVQASLGLRTKNGAVDVSTGTTVAINSSASIQYSDQARVRYLNGSTTGYDGYTPTEVLYSSDPAAQARLAALGPSWRFQTWHRPTGIPRFTQVQKHDYETVTVTHKSDVAYFVGLSELRMYRVDYTVADNTDAYLLPFQDRAGLDDADDLHPWQSDTPSGLISPAVLGQGYAQTTSLPLNSRSRVRGIQFATVQTPAQQRLANSEFTSMDGWEIYGSASVPATPDVDTTDIGSTVEISRSTPSSTWDALEYADWPTDTTASTWDNLESRTWDLLQDPPGSDVPYGGIQGDASSYYQPAPQGRIYAAARVYTPQALRSPLHLQIIDSDGNALAEAEISPKPGGVTEWYCGYTLGSASFDESALPTWDTQETVGTWDEMETVGTWDDVMGGIVSPYQGPVTARLFQGEPSYDSWYVDNISLYEDPIVWEFSNDNGENWWPGYDIRNDPNGVLLFPEDYATPASIADSESLMWRVTTYQPGVRVSAAFIRPWYDTLPLGVPSRETINHGGPNISAYDQYPDVSDSAPFKMWSKPIPEDWWFNYRQWLLQGGIPTTALPQPVTPTTVSAYLAEALLYRGMPIPSVVLGEALVLLPPPAHPTVLLGEGLVLAPA